jgi:hypothetical protein
MELAIEIIKRQGVMDFSLIDLELSLSSNNLITSGDLSEIRASFWYNPLKANDNKSVLDSCTNNQLITTVYFYIDNNPASKSLMAQWFIDTGCTHSMARELAKIVFNARVFRMEDNIDLTKISLFQSLEERYCINVSNTPLYESLELTEILQLMKSGKSIQWRFDSVSSLFTGNYHIVDISGLIESAFVIEDHHSIITGFSAKYITCLDLLAGHNTRLLSHLSDYVPLGLRDTMSIGSAIIKFQAISEILLNAGYNEINFVGIDSEGKVKMYNEPLKRSNIQISEPHGSEMLMPLFIKFNK